MSQELCNGCAGLFGERALDGCAECLFLFCPDCLVRGHDSKRRCLECALALVGLDRIGYTARWGA